MVPGLRWRRARARAAASSRKNTATSTWSSQLGAIALHDDPSADAAVERFVAPDRPLEVRKQAAFWLGNARGRRGYEVLAALARKEESEELRRHVTFALSQSREPEAVETMIAM